MKNGRLIVCFYSYLSSSVKGASGGNVSNQILVEALDEFASITLVCPTIDESSISYLKGKGITVISAGFRSTGLLSRIMKRRWCVDNLRSLLDKESSNISAIISSNGLNDVVSNLLTSSNTHVRHIIVTRAYEDMLRINVGFGFKRKLKNYFLRLAYERALVACYQGAWRVLTNSLYMKRVIQECFSVPANRVDVLYPPLDLQLQPFRGGGTRIGMINPTQEKGRDVFLQLARENKHLSFRYFAKENLMFEGENIVYMGWCVDRAGLFSEIDILLVPSQWNEPFGRVGVEAIGSGIPALVSNCGGLPESVDDAFVVAKNDVAAWQERLVWLSAEPAEVEAAWRRSMVILQSFLLDRHRDGVMELVRDIFSGDNE